MTQYLWIPAAFTVGYLTRRFAARHLLELAADAAALVAVMAAVLTVGVAA